MGAKIRENFQKSLQGLNYIICVMILLMLPTNYDMPILTKLIVGCTAIGAGITLRSLIEFAFSKKN